jgi:hypothetical protein
LRNICSLTPPATGWDKPPAATDMSKEADLARIKLYRNERYGHITETAISDSDFEKYWKDIEALFLRLGGTRYQPDIERLKVVTMDPDDEQYYIKATEEWEQLEQRIMSKLDEVINMRNSPSIADDSQSKGMQISFSPCFLYCHCLSNLVKQKYPILPFESLLLVL